MRLNILQTIKRAWQQSALILVKQTDKPIATTKFKKKHFQVMIGGPNALVVKDTTTYSKLRYLMTKISRQETSDKYHLKPPETVRGMQTLVKESFTEIVSLPAIKIEQKKLQETRKYWKSYAIDTPGIAPVALFSNKNPQRNTHCLLLLDPELLELEPFSEEAKNALSLVESSIKYCEVELTFDNWSHKDIMRAVLPEYVEQSSYNITGHIALVNLDESTLPFAKIIAEVILQRSARVRTVVTKQAMISGPYRNTSLTLLAGEEDYLTQINTEGCSFSMDYSKVYWNSRLNSEHSRVIRSISFESVVYDMFAGIGPFAIPLAKKKLCEVFANDLNPYSYEYLIKNVNSNLQPGCGTVSCFNVDGREFVQTIVKDDLTKRITQLLSGPQDDCMSTPSSYVVMNLPGQAVDFLNEFHTLLGDLPESYIVNKNKWAHLLPTVYCYTFISRDEDLIKKQEDFNNDRQYNIDGKEVYMFKHRNVKSGRDKPKVNLKNGDISNPCPKISQDMMSRIKAKVERVLTHSVPKDFSVRYVRTVAPNKDMVCINFKIWPELVIKKSLR